MRRAAGRASDALAGASGALMGAILVTLVALDAAQVALRYALGTGWPWAGDLGIVLLLTLAWVGAGHLWLRGAHIAVSLLPPGPARAMDLVFALAAVAGGALVVPMALEAMALYGAIDLPALPAPASVKYAPVMVGVAWVALAAALRLAAGRTAA